MQTTKMNTQSKKRGKNANRKTVVSDIAGQEARDAARAEIPEEAVSYTHLTLPADFHSCEVMGGRDRDFQWLVPLALANFTGTFVSRQPLLQAGQAYAEIRRYGIYDVTAFDEWSENNNDNS